MIELYFKDVKLGELHFDGNLFIYNSIIENEKMAIQKYFLNFTDYNLFNSQNKKSQKMFDFFEKIINLVKKREDLIDLLKINNTNSNFEILEKLGKHKQSNLRFYVVSV